MDFEENYEIDLTTDFIHSRNFTRVALQFPDELLKDSVRVVSALRNKLELLEENGGDRKEIRLFVMADTAYGSCCVDEVGASHANADCVIHYGHTCLSPTSNLPAFFVFGKASINVSSCAQSLSDYAFSSTKPIMVLYGLEYAHAIPHIRQELIAAASMQSRPRHSELHFADVMCSAINPSNNQKKSDEPARLIGDCVATNDVGEAAGCRHKIGGLIWDLSRGQRMEDYLLVWIGSGNSAFANVVLTFNGCEIVRYDAKESRLVTDLSQQRRILKRRYYLVEKAKDANIVGILVGTLGVAGYLDMIHQMKDLITSAGKKAYTLVMGRPNPAKLANFPECDIFIYVSCAQTALLDSKEFLAPVITPFEAMIAFNRGSQWTGAYVMEFRDLIDSSPVEAMIKPAEARFSFIQGRYVEDFDLQENIEEDNEGLALANATEKALQLHDRNSTSLIKGTIKSGAEYFANRSYQGLEMHGDNSKPGAFLIGRTGKASGYENEKTKQ
ncbi:diphteria toxin resistance protein 2, dph2, putative [Ricinus communis]|uniref:2-(3-amino-3-carboxypropyl)histidine synthase subunit 2 n=1 Tax=Ricinus communis TaxID=3988 RepID=B9SX45_RICCO|nr:diphteria toxin resistance protein 2, dph2, putative [Ricinus communis]|eukprot:XP_002530564.1 2-(3-amino-3-carboxypropyl)histidine synthase subunit 2 [Ricinus communis]